MINITKKELENLYIYKNFTIAKIADILNCHKDTIFRRLKKFKILSKTNSDYSKYNVDKLFFKIPSLENSYWAGFIAADAHIFKNKRGLKIELQYKDRKILEQFQKVTKFTGIIKDNIKKAFNKEYLQSLLVIHGVSEWIYDLENNFNVYQNKSFILQPPYKLDINNSLAYIIGFIDGDGCIGLYNRATIKKKFLDFKICGQKEILQWMSTQLYTLEKSIYMPANVRLNSQKTIYELHYKTLRAYNLLSNLLEINVPFRLNRKWCKVLEYSYQ